MNCEALEKIFDLEQKYCDHCLLKKVNRQNMSKAQAHHFCISECSVGNRIQSYGNQLQ